MNRKVGLILIASDILHVIGQCHVELLELTYARARAEEDPPPTHARRGED